MPEEIPTRVSTERKLCLVMIVRNEAPRMERLLDSVAGLIDEVVISDTGSPDNTIEVTLEKCKKLGIRCHVDETKFRDFGFNRTRSIEVAVKSSKCEYLLFLDADMKLVISPNFNRKDLLNKGFDVMSIMQKSPNLEWYNMRIIRRLLPGLKCEGVTHEHYAYSCQAKQYNIPDSMLYIDDVGDGGSKADKFERDYRLLKKGLEDDPKNIRYMFYLAETCRHDKKYLESIQWYRKRIKGGVWDEEVYRSLYGISMCYIGMGNIKKADSYAIKANVFRPSRIECLYSVCRWHRENGRHNRAYQFYQLGYRVARPKDDMLFVEIVPYSWGWAFEFAILAYYNEIKNSKFYVKSLTSKECLKQILISAGTGKTCGSTFPQGEYELMLNNTAQYIELLPLAFVRKDYPTFMVQGYNTSTPGIVRLADYGLVRHARLVSYKIIRATGAYIMPGDGLVKTTYSVQWPLTEPWRHLKEDCEGIPTVTDNKIKNIEDVRLFNLAPSTGLLPSVMSDKDRGSSDKERVYGIGTTIQYSKDSKLTMVLVEANIEKGVFWPIKRIPRVYDCEKNHAPISGTNLCVHSWGPKLKIYDLVKTTEDEIHWVHEIPEEETPGYFRRLRGSSCGIPWPSTGPPREYWFICHSVFHETPRRYVHSVVVLDSLTFKPISYSIPFNFDEYKIEFVGGIAFEDKDRVLTVGFSVFDSSSREIKIPVDYLRKQMMIPFPHV